MDLLLLGAASYGEGAGAALEAKTVSGWDPRPPP